MNNCLVNNHFGTAIDILVHIGHYSSSNWSMTTFEGFRIFLGTFIHRKIIHGQAEENVKYLIPDIDSLLSVS